MGVPWRVKLLLVAVPLVIVESPYVHLVLPDQADLIEVNVRLSELLIFDSQVLKVCNLVQDAQIGRLFLRVEFVTDLFKQFNLLLSQLVVFPLVCNKRHPSVPEHITRVRIDTFRLVTDL